MLLCGVWAHRRWQTDLPAGIKSCFSLTFARGSKWAAAGSMGSSVWVVDVSTGKVVALRTGHGRPQVAWATGAETGPLLLVASTSGLTAFRVKTGEAAESREPPK